MIECRTSNPTKFNELMVSIDTYLKSLNVKDVSFKEMVGDVVLTEMFRDNAVMYCVLNDEPKRLRADNTQYVTLLVTVEVPMKDVDQLYTKVKNALTSMDMALGKYDLRQQSNLELSPTKSGTYNIKLTVNIKAKEAGERIPYDAGYRFIVSKKSGDNGIDTA